MNKKAALELSMNTIVVIVIGVTILSLGLVFVKNMMDKTGGLTDEAFSRADSEIQRMWGEINEPLTLVPENIDVEIGGDTVGTYVVIFNDGATSKRVKATVTGDPSDSNVVCIFGDSKKQTSNEYPLPSGEKVKIKLLVTAKKGATLEIGVCNVKVEDIVKTLTIQKEG